MMSLIEQKFSTYRLSDEAGDPYQTIDVVIEHYMPDRQYLKFSLMETRWRSKDEAVAYLRWAADQIQELTI